MAFSLFFAFGVLLIVPQSEANAAFKVDYDEHCDCIYMVNLDTGMVVYEKNAEKVKYPASLTKMLTCIIAVEYFTDPASEYVTISNAVMTDRTLINNQVWSTSYLKEGERVTLRDLLYGAMLPSDNHAALAIAYYVSEQKGNGTLQWFIDKMNAKAEELGCTNSLFMNPHGLYAEHHTSTAKDLYLIAKAGMELDYFADIVSTTVYKRGATNKNTFPEDEGFVGGEARLENSNKMLSTAYERLGYYYQYVKGIKTGFLKVSHHNLATYATRNGYSYILITLDDGQEKNGDTNYCMIDSRALYYWAFTNLTLREIISSTTPIATVEIEYAWKADTIDLYAAEGFTTLLPNHIKQSSIMVVPDIEEKVRAPVKKGDVLGTAQLIYGTEVIGTVQLVAGETVQRSELLYILGILSGMVGSIWFYLFVGLAVLAAVVYVMYTLIKAKNMSSLKRVRRYRKM